VGVSALFGLLLGLLSGCQSTPKGEPEAAPPPAAGDKRGSLDELRELIRQGSVAPISAEVVEETEAADPLTPAGAGQPKLPATGLPAGVGKAIDRPLTPPQGSEMIPESLPDLKPSGDGLALPRPGLADRPGPEAFAQNPFLRFGERLLVHPDGSLTKPFPLQAGRGRKLLNLLLLTSDLAIDYSILDAGADPKPMQLAPTEPGRARIVLLEKWDFEQYQSFSRESIAAPTAPSDIMIADWLVVSGNEETLAEVQGFIELFAGSVPQIEIEASVVEVTNTEELDYGVRGPATGVLFDFPTGTFVDSLGYNLPNQADANEALLTIGTITDGLAINAVLEAIQTWENVNITTRPKIAVREGGVAEVLDTREIPFFEFSGLSGVNQNFNANLKFKEVGIKLYVAPRVVGTSTLALNLYIEASQQIGTAIAFFDSEGNQFSSPLIAKRQARTVVYLEPGQALVIGGLETVREVDQERKVPILGDIPLLGLLFRSDLKRKERTNVLFFIRPRILQGTDFGSSL
jgi:hypothetical protein